MERFHDLVDPLAGLWEHAHSDAGAAAAVDGRVRKESSSESQELRAQGSSELVAACLATLHASGNMMWRTEELRDLGFGQDLLASLCAKGPLMRIRRGCYVRAGQWSSLSSEEQDVMRVQAYAHRTALAPGRYSFSHTSAARLHRLKLWKAPGGIHVSLPFLPSASGYAADVVTHSKAVAPDEIVEIDGLPATSLERTVTDCCGLLNYRQSLLILTDHALRKGAGAGKLREYCLAMEGRPGVVNLRKVLATADARSESPGETLTRDVLRKFRTPAPVLQHEVRTKNGLARMDFAWPDRMAALEFDGKAKYFDCKPTEQMIFEERQREKALLEDGWRILRIEWRDLFREQELRARVLRLLDM